MSHEIRKSYITYFINIYYIYNYWKGLQVYCSTSTGFCAVISKEDFLLPMDDPSITAELDRREEQRRKADNAEATRKNQKKEKSAEADSENPEEIHFEKSSKWKEQHMALAESRP